MIDKPKPYRVVYAKRTQEHLILLGDMAIDRGDGEAYLMALKDFDSRLKIYPQFGDPLRNINLEKGILYNGIIRPLVMQYIVLEDLRIVYVAALPILMRLLS